MDKKKEEAQREQAINKAFREVIDQSDGLMAEEIYGRLSSQAREDLLKGGQDE